MSFLTSVFGIDPIIKASREKRWKDARDLLCVWLESRTSGKDRNAILGFTAVLRLIPLVNEPQGLNLN